MRFLFLLFALTLGTSAFAQDAIDAALPGAPAQEEATDAPIASQPGIVQPAPVTPAPTAPTDEPVIPTYEAQKYAVLQTLDKLTARTATMTVPVGQATAVGPLFVDIKSCRKTPPSELPESVAFLQIWEAKPKPKLKKKTLDDGKNTSPSQWVFSGWMFASSPALSAMDHPVYDVWLKDCVSEIAASKSK